MMLPTARAAPGVPASRATSPYVVTRPTGMRRTTASTRRVNVGSAANADFDAEGAAAKVVLVERR